MSERSEDIKTLARMAARLAGRDPDEHVILKLAGMVAFDDQLWRYPDFLTRAETAYEALGGRRLVRPEELNGHNVSVRHDQGIRMAVAEVNGKVREAEQAL